MWNVLFYKIEKKIAGLFIFACFSLILYMYIYLFIYYTVCDVNLFKFINAFLINQNSAFFNKNSITKNVVKKFVKRI